MQRTSLGHTLLVFNEIQKYIPVCRRNCKQPSGDLHGQVLQESAGRAVGGGWMGVEGAVRQPPDGYTMIYGTSGTQAANLALYKNIRYDPIKDFVPVHALSAT